MTLADVEGQLTYAAAAAQAAVALLPSSSPLTVGESVASADGLAVAGQAIHAGFAGAAQGQVLVVVAQDLVDALAETPMGSLDITQAVRPAIEAAAGTLGAVVVDPGDTRTPEEALASILSAGGALVPLLDGENVRAVIGLAVSASTASEAAHPAAPVQRGSLDLLHEVEMEVTAELGRTRMSVRELLSLAPGTVIELDRAAGGPADLLVNGRLIARGEVVVIDENFGIRITEILPPTTDR